ncbi:MAG: DUF2175 domain-containing protein [Kangiellaceae bacterium]|nr:DUF2175 domain-containing protein [Kangiellaceae bacterium]
MLCIYCKKPVFGNIGLTVPKEGPAHQNCYQANQALKRTFQHLEIRELNDQELKELKELVVAEENSRSRSLDDDGVDLF